MLLGAPQNRIQGNSNAEPQTCLYADMKNIFNISHLDLVIYEEKQALC